MCVTVGDRQAITIARANIAVRVRLAQGSWFDALPAELRGRLLLVVANPPYLAERELAGLDRAVADWEPTGALVSGPTGLEAFAAIVRDVPEWLDPRGALVLELAPDQVEPVAAIVRAAGLPEVQVHPDLAGRDRVLVARRADPAG